MKITIKFFTRVSNKRNAQNKLYILNIKLSNIFDGNIQGRAEQKKSLGGRTFFSTPLDNSPLNSLT